MSLLTWFDVRTLFACQCLLTAIFTVVFLYMDRAYPQLKGMRATALAFLAAAACTLLILLHGSVPPVVMATATTMLGVLAYLGMYAGVVQFAGTRSRLKELTWTGVAAVGVVFYFMAVRPMLAPRTLAVGAAIAVIRGMTAWVLLGLSNEEQRGEAVLRRTLGTRLLLGSFVALMAVMSMERGVTAAIGAGQQNLVEMRVYQTSTLALNLAYVTVFGVCFLVMASQELIAQSQEESEHDALTGLLNRRGVEVRLEQELRRSERSGERLCVALVDVDRFKAINDSLGHADGDEALRGAAGAMRRRLREVDVLARYGGDEFLLVMPHTGLDATPVVAERLGLEVSRAGMLRDGRRLTISIGLTEAGPEDDVAGLVARADEALYAAKRAGRSCWRMAEPERRFGEPGMGIRVVS